MFPKTDMRNRIVLLLYALTALITIALYVPFLDSAIVFDDHNIFTNLSIYDCAITIFNATPRTFPYFTLGFTEVMWKSIEVHRSINLFLHVANALTLFRLLSCLFEQIAEQPHDKSQLLGFAGSLFFAIHPVAVYGVGYLIQRTILFATLFSLLCIWFYWRSLAQDRPTYAISAALFYALSIYSKEHAIMLPVAVLALTALHEAPWKVNRRKAVLFAALCAPPAIFVILNLKGLIGSPAEPESGKFLSELLPITASRFVTWLHSIATQTGLFFQYLQAWLAPDLRNMSADIRVDFVAGWSPAWIATKVASFVVFWLLAIHALRQGSRIGLLGFGMLYTCLLFLTEFASFRFQEPFVLYRSYLWAPGIVIALMTMLSQLSRKALVVATVISAPLLFVAAHDRLGSFKDEQALWEDVVAKLPSHEMLGADRIFYNRGIQYLRAKRFQEAIADFSKSIRQNPAVFQVYQQRGIAFYSIFDYPPALADFDQAITQNEHQGLSYFGRAMVLEKLGCFVDANTVFQKSKELGFLAAEVHLNEQKKGGAQPPPSTFDCPSGHGLY